jgi:hypothetical protein
LAEPYSTCQQTLDVSVLFLIFYFPINKYCRKRTFGFVTPIFPRFHRYLVDRPKYTILFFTTVSACTYNDNNILYNITDLDRAMILLYDNIIYFRTRWKTRVIKNNERQSRTRVNYCASQNYIRQIHTSLLIYIRHDIIYMQHRIGRNDEHCIVYTVGWSANIFPVHTYRYNNIKLIYRHKNCLRTSANTSSVRNRPIQFLMVKKKYICIMIKIK